MSLQMNQYIENQLSKSVLGFLKHSSQAPESLTGSKIEPEEALLQALRQSYQAGGLDGVDALISSINSAIKSTGGREGLGEGAALQHADGEYPAYLHIFFVEFGSDKVLARQSIPLKKEPAGQAPY